MVKTANYMLCVSKHDFKKLTLGVVWAQTGNHVWLQLWLACGSWGPPLCPQAAPDHLFRDPTLPAQNQTCLGPCDHRGGCRAPGRPLVRSRSCSSTTQNCKNGTAWPATPPEQHAGLRAALWPPLLPWETAISCSDSWRAPPQGDTYSTTAPGCWRSAERICYHGEHLPWQTRTPHHGNGPTAKTSAHHLSSPLAVDLTAGPSFSRPGADHTHPPSSSASVVLVSPFCLCPLPAPFPSRFLSAASAAPSLWQCAPQPRLRTSRFYDPFLCTELPSQHNTWLLCQVWVLAMSHGQLILAFPPSTCHFETNPQLMAPGSLLWATWWEHSIRFSIPGPCQGQSRCSGIFVQWVHPLTSLSSQQKSVLSLNH